MLTRGRPAGERDVAATTARARVGPAMMFGYIGYIWAMFGCCTLVGVFGGSAAFLYGVARRRGIREGQANIVVERIETPEDEPPSGGDGA